MGNFRSGRRPLPTAIHRLRGTRSKARPGDVEPKRGRPDPPDEVTLDPQALAHWTRLAGQLQAMGVLAPTHGSALGLLASALADYGRMRAQLHQLEYRVLYIEETLDPKTGAVIRRRPRENLLLRRCERQALLCARLLGEFGLTPVTQTKLQGEPEPQRAVRLVDRYIGPA
jgi:hypothetical protein